MYKAVGIPLPWWRTPGAFRTLTLTSVVAVFALVTMGGVVRVTESGLACPDWPLCHGRIIPPLELAVIVEYSHRLGASAVTVLVLATATFVWLFHRSQVGLVIAATLALILLAGQVALGGITVLLELPSGVVLAHLAVAEALVAAMVVVCIAAWSNGDGMVLHQLGWQSWRSGFPGLVLASTGAVYVLLLTGSYVTVSGASLACGDAWPLCAGGLFPSTTPAIMHMVHRLAALLVGIALFGVLGLAWQYRHQRPGVWWLVVVVGILFGVQAVVGALNVWLGLPQSSQLLHLVMGTLVWIFMVMLAVLSFSSPRSFSTILGR